jgi:hypothetical protein
MRIPSERTTIPMSATAYVERARGWARLLEDREAAATGEPLTSAREAEQEENLAIASKMLCERLPEIGLELWAAKGVGLAVRVFEARAA